LSPRVPKFRLLCDENLPAPAGKFLKSLGHNVICIAPKGKRKGLSDLAQIKEAAKENRIFVSLDKDFRVNENLRGAVIKSAGIILVVSSDPQSEKIILILKRRLKEITARKMKGKICQVSVDKIIFRGL